MEGFGQQPDGSGGQYLSSYNGDGGGESYPLQGIKFPGMNDVMCGRGGATNNHIGNIRFRQLVNEHKRRYLAATKVEKPRVALEVVKMWRGLDPPGRFLAKTHTALGDASPWHDVGDKKAREKASQCLRERTPDVIPFVRQLEQQEKEKKAEQAKSAAGINDSEVPIEFKKTTPNSRRSEPDSAAAEAPLKPQVQSSSTVDKPKRKSKSRNEFASTIPTGAALTRVVFSDDTTDGIEGTEAEDTREFMDDYQQVLQDLAQSAVNDTAATTSPEAIKSREAGGRPLLDKTTSGTSGFSWMKSFKSIDSNFSAMEQSAYSMRDTKGNHDDDDEDEDQVEIQESYDDIPEDAVQNPPVASAMMRDFGRKPKTIQASYAPDSQMSIMSDLSSRSLTADQLSKRQLMASNSADQASKRSVLSAMSDMTELSDALKDMDLSTVGGGPGMPR